MDAQPALTRDWPEFGCEAKPKTDATAENQSTSELAVCKAVGHEGT